MKSGNPSEGALFLLLSLSLSSSFFTFAHIFHPHKASVLSQLLLLLFFSPPDVLAPQLGAPRRLSLIFFPFAASPHLLSKWLTFCCFFPFLSSFFHSSASPSSPVLPDSPASFPFSQETKLSKALIRSLSLFPRFIRCTVIMCWYSPGNINLIRLQWHNEKHWNELLCFVLWKHCRWGFSQSQFVSWCQVWFRGSEFNNLSKCGEKRPSAASSNTYKWF